MTQHSGPIVGQRDNLTAIDCEHCEFIHLDPIPDTAIYREGFYHREVKPDMLKDYTEDRQWWNSVYGDWMVLLYTHRNVRRLLDIGSGTGDFVTAAASLFPIVLGAEPDENMANLNSMVMQAEYAEVNSTGWDVISSHWTLEHLPDPAHFFRWTRDRLDDGGLLLLTIPNDFSPLQQQVMDYGLLSIPDYYWLNEHHSNYWNHASFTKLLTRHGYEVLEVYGSWEPEQYLLNGVNYLRDHKLGRTIHGDRQTMDLQLSREVRLAKYLQMGREGRGRDLTFLARKI